MNRKSHVLRDAKLTWCASKAKAPLRPGDIGSFADSSWSDVKPSRKSTNCHYILCNNALVHSCSKIASILGGLIPDIIQDDNNLVDDDAESSEDDVVDKTVEEMQQVLVKVPAFNPLRTEEARNIMITKFPNTISSRNFFTVIFSFLIPS
jgi:hypothetical protein